MGTEQSQFKASILQMDPKSIAMYCQGDAMVPMGVEKSITAASVSVKEQKHRYSPV